MFSDGGKWLPELRDWELVQFPFLTWEHRGEGHSGEWGPSPGAGHRGIPEGVSGARGVGGKWVGPGNESDGAKRRVQKTKRATVCCVDVKMANLKTVNTVYCRQRKQQFCVGMFRLRTRIWKKKFQPIYVWNIFEKNS